MNEHWFWIVYNQGNCKLQEVFENLYDCPWIYSYEFYTLPTWNKSLACATLSFDLKVAAAAAKSLQSCPTLWDPMDCSLPGFSVHGILQARTLAAAAAAAKSLQSCPTLCHPRDGSPPGCPVPGILQARTLEWVAISFSNAWSEKWKRSRSVVSNPQQPHGLQPTRLLHPWDFPGKSTGVGCHCLLWILRLQPYKLNETNFLFLHT